MSDPKKPGSGGTDPAKGGTGKEPAPKGGGIENPSPTSNPAQRSGAGATGRETPRAPSKPAPTPGQKRK